MSSSSSNGGLVKRGSTWWIDFRVEGRRFRESAGTTRKAEAREFLLARISEEREATAREGTVRMADLWDAFVEENGSDYNRESSWARAIAHWGEDFDASSLTPAECSRWSRSLTGGGQSAATVRRWIAAVAAVFAWGARAGIIDANPFIGSWRPQVARQRKEGLEMAAVADVLAAVKGTELERAYMLAFFAGLRRGEIAAATWADVDLDRGMIQVRGTKTAGSEQAVPLHPELAKFLAGLPEREGPLAGTDSPARLSHLIRQARREHPELPGLHSGRHTLGTALARAGVDMARVQKVLRHTKITTTIDFYAHLRPQDVAQDLTNFQVPGRES
jgi:integrase